MKGMFCALQNGGYKPLSAQDVMAGGLFTSIY